MPLGWIAAAAIVGTAASTAVGAANASTAAGIANQQEGQSGSIFGEQQYFEQQLANLVANPGSVTSLPGYQFNFQQGQQSVARQMAAGGFGQSGNEAAALTQYGQGYAMNTYQQQAQLLAQLSGITNASSPSQGGAAATGANSSSASQFNNLFANLGVAGGFAYSQYGSAGGYPAPYNAAATTPGPGGYTFNTPN